MAYNNAGSRRICWPTTCAMVGGSSIGRRGTKKGGKVESETVEVVGVWRLVVMKLGVTLAVNGSGRLDDTQHIIIQHYVETTAYFGFETIVLSFCQNDLKKPPPIVYSGRI